MVTIFNQNLRVIAITKPEILFLVFSLMFYHSSLKNNRELRVKIFTFLTLTSVLNVMKYFNHSEVYDGIKICSQLHFFTYESIITCDNVETSCLHSDLVFFSISKIQYKNSNSYFNLLLLLSGDISLNPGPPHNNQLQPQNEWSVFNSRGLHFIHLNINSLLPKMDELRNIAKLSNATVIGIGESKLDDSVLSSEIHIDNYNALRCDRNRHGGGVVCYIRNDLSYEVKSFFPPEIENIFFEILLPNTKPIIVGIIYRPPSQSEFLEIINTHFSKLDTNNNEIYILGDFNINLYLNNSYIFLKNNLLQSQSITSDIKKYYEFFTMFGLKQLIEVPTRVTCSSSTIIDHILASFPNRVSQQGVIDVGLSDHQIVYCTRKISRIKRGTHKQIRCRSLKNYSAVIYEEALGKIDFPNYHNFDNIDDACSNFTQKVMGVIDQVAPIKLRRIKQNSQEWFDGEVAEKISVRDKLFKKSKKSKLHIDKEIYKIARCEVQKLISYKKKRFFENKLNDSIGKPKELWKALKSLGLPSKTSICETTARKVKNARSFETKSKLEVFKNCYSTLAENLLKKLPIPPNIYTFNSVRHYYRHLFQNDAFHLTYTTEIDIEKILRGTKFCKAAGIDDLSVVF